MRKSDLTKNWWWTQVLANGKHSLFFIRQSCDSWTQVRWVKPSAVPWQKRVSCHTYMFRDVDISSVSAILLLGFGTVPTVWYHWNCSDSVVLLELFRQCGIIGSVLTVWYYWNCSDSVVLLELFRQCGIIGTVLTVWYYWNCSDSVVLLELFRQCGIIGTVPTVWYYWNCSDSVVLLWFFISW